MIIMPFCMGDELNNMDIEDILNQAKLNISKALSPDLQGEYDLSDAYVLIKDLAHTGGKMAAPISIMRVGNIFYKQKDSGYYSDGFHLILGRICKNCPDYFRKVVVN